MGDKVKNFIADIIKVYEKHQLTIAHEDEHGSFLIDRYCESNIEWLQQARINFSPYLCPRCDYELKPLYKIEDKKTFRCYKCGYLEEILTKT